MNVILSRRYRGPGDRQATLALLTDYPPPHEYRLVLHITGGSCGCRQLSTPEEITAAWITEVLALARHKFTLCGLTLPEVNV